MGSDLFLLELHSGHEPDVFPLTRPPGTLSPAWSISAAEFGWGEGWGEGTGLRFMGRLRSRRQRAVFLDELRINLDAEAGPGGNFDLAVDDFERGTLAFESHLCVQSLELVVGSGVRQQTDEMDGDGISQGHSAVQPVQR